MQARPWLLVHSRCMMSLNFLAMLKLLRESDATYAHLEANLGLYRGDRLGGKG